jgi:hypothetical protein
VRSLKILEFIKRNTTLFTPATVSVPSTSVLYILSSSMDRSFGIHILLVIKCALNELKIDFYLLLLFLLKIVHTSHDYVFIHFTFNVTTLASHRRNHADFINININIIMIIIIYLYYLPTLYNIEFQKIRDYSC